MEEVLNTGNPAPGDTEIADGKPLLEPETAAEGAAAGGDGSETAAAAANGGDDKPLLTPGVDENGKSELVGAPEAYGDFSMPEGFVLDEDMKAQVTGLFKELDLSQKGAQKLIDAYAERIVAQKEAELSDLADRRKQWRSEVRQRPTYAADRALAVKGINAVVTTPEEREMFTDSWMSDHPVLFGLFVKIGKLVGEDSPLPNGGNSTAEAGSAESRFPIKL